MAVALGTGMGCLETAAVFIENVIAKDEREPMPALFPFSVHNAAAAQVAIDQNARGLNSAPTCGEISFECALWSGMSQLANDEADCVLTGAVDELNKYILGIGQRWGIWSEQNRPGEGAMIASLVRAENSIASDSLSPSDGERGFELENKLPPLPGPLLHPMEEREKTRAVLARVTAVRLGRWRKPFDAAREADWIAASVDLKNVDVILSGAKGWPELDAKYAAVAAALSARANRPIEHQTYKQHCGEFHSASAFGFSVAVELVRQRQRGVLLYTLSPKGGKAFCCLQP